MAFKWPWQNKADEVTKQRSYDVPDKAFIEREATGHYEYSFDDPRIHGWIDNLLSGFYGAQNFIELFHCLPEVFAPVHEIASRVSDCNWQLRKIRKTGGEFNDQPIYDDAQFNRLFTQPNPLMSIKQFVYQAVCYEILTGKQFFYFNKPDMLPDEFNSVVNWWNLQAQNVAVDMRKDIDPYTATTLSDFIIQYTQPVNGRNRVFQTSKVLPLCNMSLTHSTNVNQAKSILRGADKPIRNLIPVYEARGVIYIKRGALGFLVSKKGDAGSTLPLTQSEKKRLREDADKTYGLTGNKSTIGITDVPVEFVRTAMSIKELEPFEETLADAVAIYATLRVPRHLVPSKDTSTFANANSDMKSFYSDVIIPMAKRYAEAWTSYLKLEDQRRYIYADFSHVDVLQENKKEKADVDSVNGKTYREAWLSGACTLNDWIVARGDQKVTGPLYDKKLLELTPEELDQVKAVINLKAVEKPDPADQKPNEKPVTA